MANLQWQLHYITQALNCSATLEHVSSHLRICHLSIPWCRRQLQWQVLLPPPPHSAPDLLFDDDTFMPLCGPAHHFSSPSKLPEPGSPGCTHVALRELLRGWSNTASCTPKSAATAAPIPHDQTLGEATAIPSSNEECVPRSSADLRLLQLVSVLLDAYREHQMAKLAAVAAAFPRIQFELSTLELGRGMQLEHQQQQQQQQVCFALHLPPLDLRHFLELAELFGARVSPPPPPPPPPPLPPPRSQQQLAAAGNQHDSERSSRPPLPPSPQQRRSHADALKVELLEEGTQLLGDGQSGRTSRGGQEQGQGQGPEVSAPGGSHQRWQEQLAGTEFTLLATFRLPVVGAGDVPDPELTLQLPRVLLELKATEGRVAGATGAAAGGPASASGSVASNASGSGVNGSWLLPSFLLPLWSPHMCLAEYIPLAVERLQAQLDSHCNVLSIRQQLLEQLGEMLGGALEVNLQGGAALYAVSWEGTPVLISLELGTRFPTDKPTMVLQCLRVLPGADAFRTYRDYPWSPRWGPGEMAARIHNWLQEELPLFLRGRAPQP